MSQEIPEKNYRLLVYKCACNAVKQQKIKLTVDSRGNKQAKEPIPILPILGVLLIIVITVILVVTFINMLGSAFDSVSDSSTTIDSEPESEGNITESINFGLIPNWMFMFVVIGFIGTFIMKFITRDDY